MFWSALFILLVPLSNAYASDKQVAVTIDDLPFLYGRYLSDSVENSEFRHILEVLRKHQVQAIGFVVGSRINDRNRVLLDEFVADGHEIGNHTFTHPDLNSTTASWYIDDINACQLAIEKWVGQEKYFRYPFLHQGPTASKYNRIREYLSSQAFINVPATIDNDDWLFNRHFTKALRNRDKAFADSIGQEYLAHMKKKTRHFDSLATASFGRPIKHILLLHMTELNSLYLDSLLVWYEEQGWSFIPPQEALTDSLYRMRDTYVGANGTSWLLRFDKE